MGWSWVYYKLCTIGNKNVLRYYVANTQILKVSRKPIVYFLYIILVKNGQYDIKLNLYEVLNRTRKEIFKVKMLDLYSQLLSRAGEN